MSMAGQYGYFAVDFFLVLSGFVLAGAYGEAATTVNGYVRSEYSRKWNE